MASRLLEYDRGYKGIVKATIEAAGPRVVVGVMGKGRAARGDLTIGELAMVQEFGTKNGHVPERSFLRSTMDEQRVAIANLQEKLLKLIQDGKISPEEALRRVGVFAKSKVIAKIDSSVPPPNAPSTIRRKGHGRTLRETDTLRNAVDYEVRSAQSVQQRRRARQATERG